MSYGIKRCPYCGCTELCISGCATFGNVRCKRCGATVKSDISVSDAIDKWNRRCGWGGERR